LFEADSIELELNAARAMRDASQKTASFTASTAATATGTRSVLGAGGQRIDVPVYQLAAMAPGDYASGPAILEEDYFTCRVLNGWRLVVSEVGDVILNKEG
jgi:N-methylhydantoinase A/oxoprolinase/acetone carboxylase beta subunit